MRARSFAAALGATAALIATPVIGAAPASAASSKIDIGYTVVSGKLVKGSGSTTNNGDYTNVCVVIMESFADTGYYSNASQSCTSARGYHNWSAPDHKWSVLGRLSCTNYFTRITAYRNGSKVAEKKSNTVRVCGSGL